LQRQGDDIQAQTQIEMKQQEIASTHETIKSLEREVRGGESQTDTMGLQLLTELGKSRTVVETQLIELKSTLQSYVDAAETYVIKSRKNGKIHFFVPSNAGLAVQQNQVIAEVAEEGASSIAEVYILATDITNVTVGDTVNVAIAGVNTVKYGTLAGKIERIDAGTIAQEQEEGSQLYYKGYVTLETTTLADQKGHTVDAIRSLPIEARIIYERETYWEWVLKQIGFKQ